jgi:hypothetical protein
MQIHQGRVAELKLHQGEICALIACSSELVPTAGQYLLAAEKGAITASPLFLADSAEQGFLAAPPFPDAWEPGTELSLYGPAGKGFHPPADARRLALIAFGSTKAPLIPLVNTPRTDFYNVALFSELPFSDLPPDLEAYPLSDLAEALSWADFFAVVVPLEDIDSLGEYFEDVPAGRGQVLVHASLPCGGLADCGVCAVKVRKSWKLACKDGPVFDLRDILDGVRR